MKAPTGVVKLVAPLGHVLKKLQTKSLTKVCSDGHRVSDFPKIFTSLPIKELIIRTAPYWMVISITILLWTTDPL